MGNMILKVSTNKVGSECNVDLSITKEEWGEMSEEQQNEEIKEMMWNVLDVWVEEEE